MKHIIILLVFLFTSFFSIAQQKKVEFKVEKEKRVLCFYGINNTSQPLEITLTINDIKMLKGYKKPITKTVSAHSKTLFIELSYTYDFYNYKLSYSYKPFQKKKATAVKKVDKTKYYLKDFSKINEGIVVFDDEGCSRCRLVTNYLIDNDIDFKIINLANNKTNQKFMWKTVREKKASMKVKAPVIVVDGKLSHSHKDLNAFLKTLK